MAPEELEQGCWLLRSRKGLAPVEPEPERLLLGVTIYHLPLNTRSASRTFL